jgi:creatinine amidohydrolase/Fe(II)-dependent formamide hydrolase-like protein
MATLRAIYMDLATELGDQGFRWIFLVHNHGAPNHHKALNQASDYFHDTYGGTMVHLFGLKPVFLCCGTKETALSTVARAEEGFTVHAGADEHSQLFFLRPDLIAPDFANAPSVTARNFEDLQRIATAEGWPGYFGAPAFATAAMGAQEFQRASERLIDVALQILDGLDPRGIPRYADEMDPLNIAGEQGQLDYEATVEKRQSDWLNSRKLQ